MFRTHRTVLTHKLFPTVKESVLLRNRDNYTSNSFRFWYQPMHVKQRAKNVSNIFRLNIIYLARTHITRTMNLECFSCLIVPLRFRNDYNFYKNKNTDEPNQCFSSYFTLFLSLRGFFGSSCSRIIII